MKRCYVLGGDNSSFFRFSNSAFGSKWCGLWFPQQKVLDYHAYMVNDVWLGSQNCTGFRRLPGRAEHAFSLGGLDVSESVCLPAKGRGMVSLLRLRNRGSRKKEIPVSLKPGMNIRQIWENGHSRKYVSSGKSSIRVKSELMEVDIRTENGLFRHEPVYRTHTPGNYIPEWGWKDEFEQTVYEPGLMDVAVEVGPRKTVEVPFIFSHADDTGMFSDWRGLLAEAKKKEEELLRLYSLGQAGMAACSLASLKNRGTYMAGLPWFQNYWGRDSCWISMGAVNIGDFAGVKDTLSKLASYEKDGIIPNYINPDGGVDYGSADAPPLFMIALERYVRYSKDTAFFEQLEPVVKRILERGVDLMKNGMVRRDGRTWMDTLDRGEFCIDLQALWAEAFLCASHFFHPRYERFYSQIVQSINSRFWNGEFFADELDVDRMSANVLFPLFFKQISHNRALDAFHILESEKFTTPAGIRSLSKDDVDYDPGGYHTGCVWGLLTGMMSYAEYMYGRDVVGKKYLDIMLGNVSKRCEWSVDEVYHGDTSEPMGCVSQGWSISPVFMVLDEMVLGVKPESGHNVIVKPLDGISRRSIRIGSDIFSVTPRGKFYIVRGLKQNSLKKGRADVRLG